MTKLHVIIVSGCWFAALGLARPVAQGRPAKAAKILYVAPDGSDAWSGALAEPNAGRTDGPFASIQRAQRAVRDLRRQGKLAQPVTVRIRGVHRLREPVVFTPADSGTAACPVTYTSYEGRRAVLSGGRVVTG